MDSSRVSPSGAIILGFDGLPWSLIDRWTSDGTLPNFGRLREEGASGPMASTRPPTTPLAWTSIATGVWPDKHGIYGFQRLSSEYTHRMYTSADRRQVALWNVLDRPVVGNVPMTYPPEGLDGVVVSGMMTPSVRSAFTHPPELKDQITAQIPGYSIGLDYPDYVDRLSEFRTEIKALLDRRRRLLRLLLEHFDGELFFFVFTAPDRFQHLIWDDDELESLYIELDDILGEIMSVANEGDNDLYVVSDHGFGPLNQLVHVNRLLEREGYLVRKEGNGPRSAFSSLGISRDGVKRFLDRIGITEERLVSTIPRTVLDSLATQLPGEHSLYDVDFTQTTAFVHDAGNVYINDIDRFRDGTVEPNQIEPLKRELTNAFETVTDQGTGDPILRVFDGDELFPTDDRAPDLVVNGRNGFETRISITDTLIESSDPIAASHRSEGIFLAWGPSIESDITLTETSVVDVAPTVLHGLGKAVPENTDGSVQIDLFSADSIAGSTDVEYVPVQEHDFGSDQQGSMDDSEDVEERLRGLGYLE